MFASFKLRTGIFFMTYDDLRSLLCRTENTLPKPPWPISASMVYRAWHNLHTQDCRISNLCRYIAPKIAKRRSRTRLPTLKLVSGSVTVVIAGRVSITSVVARAIAGKTCKSTMIKHDPESIASRSVLFLPPMCSSTSLPPAPSPFLVIPKVLTTPCTASITADLDTIVRIERGSR